MHILYLDGTVFIPKLRGLSFNLECEAPSKKLGALIPIIRRYI